MQVYGESAALRNGIAMVPHRIAASLFVSQIAAGRDLTEAKASQLVFSSMSSDTVEMENLSKICPTLSMYFGRQLLKHRKHKSPPTLRLLACCHFSHIGSKVSSVILEIGE
jgi:hypothetical protein